MLSWCPLQVTNGGSIKVPPSALLNLTADALHNFTDGLAIGASFAASSPPSMSTSDLTLLPAALSMMRSRGGLAALSVLFHEIPHELGDFAVLVSAGYSRGQAVKAQFGTAVAAFIGTAVGLFSATLAAESWGIDDNSLLCFTAGGFVYLAAVSILPDLLKEPASFQKRSVQVLAFAIGIAFMRAVSELEHQMEGGSHSHGRHHCSGQEHHHHEHQHFGHHHGGHPHNHHHNEL